MTDDEAVSLVFKILGGMPVEVFDEDDGSVWENTMGTSAPSTGGRLRGDACHWICQSCHCAQYAASKTAYQKQ